MLRWIAAGVVVAVLSVFAGFMVVGTYNWEGPVLLTLSPTHGIHTNDVLVVLGWLAAVAATAVLARGE